MIKKCQQCDKEFEAIRPTKKFCSESCKQLHKRSVSSTVSKGSVSDHSVSDDLEVQGEILGGVKIKERAYTKEEVCTPEEIRDYPNMCETKRCAAEAQYKLENNELEDLEAAKVWIPNWRRERKLYE
jgi:hypothetical protein